MLRELKSSQLLEYRKMLKIILDGLDSAYQLRQGLIEYNSVSKYEKAKYDCLNDPEPFYHLKLFDKAIGIVRLYSSREWIVEDPEKKYFHFAIRIYNFVPFETFGLKSKCCSQYSTYGDFLEIDDLMPYFFKFVIQLLEHTLKVPQPTLYNLEIF